MKGVSQKVTQSEGGEGDGWKVMDFTQCNESKQRSDLGQKLFQIAHLLTLFHLVAQISRNTSIHLGLICRCEFLTTKFQKLKF